MESFIVKGANSKTIGLRKMIRMKATFSIQRQQLKYYQNIGKEKGLTDREREREGSIAEIWILKTKFICFIRQGFFL